MDMRKTLLQYRQPLFALLVAAVAVALGLAVHEIVEPAAEPPWLLSALASTWMLIGVLAAAAIGWHQALRRERQLLILAASKQETADRRLQLIADRGVDGLVLVDARGQVVYATPPAETWLGAQPGKPIGELGHQPKLGAAALVSEIHNLLHGGADMLAATCNVADSLGRERWLEVTATNDLGEPGIAAIVLRLRDVTDRREAELKARDSARMFKLVSLCNQAMVRAISPDEIFREVCNGAVGVGEFAAAWIGRFEGDAPRRHAIAAIAVQADPALARLRQIIADGNTENLALLTTLAQTEQSVVYADLLADERTERWRDDVEALGLRSFAALPIAVSGKLWGALCVCSRQPAVFDAPELALLQELAGDIGFALDVGHRDVERADAEAKVRRDEQRFRALAVFDEIEERLGKQGVVRWILESAELLTASQISYLHLYDPQTQTIQLTDWSAQTLANCRAKVDDHYPLAKAGVWADCLRRNATVVHNDFAAVPDKKGLPAGHSELRRHLSVPAIDGGQARLVLGVGNRELPYEEPEIRTVELLARRAWRALRWRDEQQALRASEARYRTIFDLSPLPMFVTDLQSLQFLLVNEAAVRFYGWSRDEFAAMRVTAIHPPELASDAEARCRAAPPVPAEYCDIVQLAKGGRRLHVDVRAVAFEFEGKPARLAAMTDVAARHLQAEQDRNRAQVMEQYAASTLRVIGNISEYRDPYTHGHERRVGLIAEALGREMGWGADACEGLRVAGLLHDIGKIGVPAEILAKPAKLTDAEFALIKDHASKGSEILRDLAFPWPVATVAAQHHERIDGSGYPRGLKGVEISAEARMIAVADVLEAMASHRPYRSALGLAAGLAELQSGAGTRYDPAMVAACLRLFGELGFKMPA